MEIPASNPTFPSLTVTKTSGEIQNWQTGQLLHAQVVSTDENGLVSLRIGARLLLAEIDARVEAGQKLVLEVTTPGEKPVLQGIRNDALGKLIEAALRSSLPNQQSHKLLLGDVKELIQQKQTIPIPDPVLQAVKKLYLSFPDKNELNTFAGLKKAIRDSGLFLEPKLASQNRSEHLALSSDFKAGLLRLQAAIQQQLGATQNPAGARVVTEGTATYSRPGIFPAAQSIQITPGVVAKTQPPPPLGITPSFRTPVSGVQISPDINITSRYENTTTVQAQTRQGNAIISGQPGTVATGAAIKTEGAGLNITGNQNTPVAEGSNAGTATQASTSRHTVIPPPLPGSQPIATTAVATETRGVIPAELTGKIEAPYLYPAGIPFRQIMGKDVVSSSEKFARLDSLTKILTHLLKDADSSLSRIQLNQLTQHHHTEPEQRPPWIFEIPVRNGDSLNLFQFKIKQDQKDKNDENSEATGWTIQISFNIENLGQVDSKITIHQKQVSIMFWTEQQETTKTFQQHLQTLQHGLEEAGLEIENLNCIQGCAPEPIDTMIGKNILDDQV